MNHQYKYDHYYTYSEITEILHKYTAEHPDYARLTSIGKTSEGREMWLLSITNTATGDYEEKVVQEAYDEEPTYIEHPAEYKTEKVQDGVKHVKEVWHYEYEKGWRDGDFKYKGD